MLKNKSSLKIFFSISPLRKNLHQKKSNRLNT